MMEKMRLHQEGAAERDDGTVAAALRVGVVVESQEATCTSVAPPM